jgi:hypothetical protein
MISTLKKTHKDERAHKKKDIADRQAGQTNFFWKKANKQETLQ